MPMACSLQRALGLSRLQIPVEECQHALLRALGVGAFEAVIGAIDGFKLGVYTGGEQAVDDPDGLFEGQNGPWSPEWRA